MEFNFSWFCHFDDDQYVNVAALESKLRQFDERKDWYLGKPSIGKPLDILDRDDPDNQVTIPIIIKGDLFVFIGIHVGLTCVTS